MPEIIKIRGVARTKNFMLLFAVTNENKLLKVVTFLRYSDTIIKTLFI